jgi:integrase
MPLSDKTVRSAKPKDKQYKLADAQGMHLLVKPNGGKYWQLRYRFAGKEKLLALGTYPQVSLLEAREKRLKARKLLEQNVDPLQAKQEEKRQATYKSENTFSLIMQEWHEARIGGWTPRHAAKILRRFEVDVFPSLAHRPINEITPPELLSVVRAIESRGAIDIAHRVLQTCSQIFRYAIAIGKAERDISADLRGALKTRKKAHYAYLKAVDLPEFLSKLEAYDGNLQTKLAIKLLMLTFVRTVELRGAKWEEINFDAAEWRIPAERMKMKQLHIVPLSRQAIAVLKELQGLHTQDFIFPNNANPLKHMSENTILFALYRMGYHSKATGHGFRATASTILNEKGFRSDVIERQLAHGERNQVRASYNHAEYLSERRQMMQWWADYLDEVAGNGEVVKVEFGKVG